MAITVSNAFVTMFGDEITHLAQQKASKLQDSVRTVRGVVGSTYKFPVLGKGGVIKNKTSHQDLEAMSSIANTAGLTSGEWVGDANVTMPHSNVTATINTYSTGEYIDDFDALKTNVDLRGSYAASIAAAMNRAYDQTIIDALDEAHANTLAAGNKLANVDLTRDNLVEISRILNANDVPMEDRYLVIGPHAMKDLMTDANIVSSDFGVISNQALSTGFIPNLFGFNVVLSNLLTTDSGTSDVRGFAFHKDAIGMAVGKDITTLVNYVPQKLSTLIASEFSAGAVAIDNSGIVSLQVNQA